MELYNTHIAGDDIQSHFHFINKSTEWVGLFEAMVFSVVFDCDINFISASTMRNVNNEWFFEYLLYRGCFASLCQKHGLNTDTLEYF